MSYSNRPRDPEAIEQERALILSLKLSPMNAPINRKVTATRVEALQDPAFLQAEEEKKRSLFGWVRKERRPLSVDSQDKDKEHRESDVVKQAYKEIKGFLNPPSSLFFLRKFERMIVKRNEDLEMESKYNGGAKYEVLDGDTDKEERVIIIAEHMQQTKIKCLSCFSGFPFEMSAFSHDGTEIFKIEGEAPAVYNFCGHCETPASVQVQDNTVRFGEIIQGHPGVANYIKINDSSGNPVFEIRATQIEKGEYNICTMYGAVLIGRISPKIDPDNNNKIVEGTFSVRFTQELPVELKAVLVATLVCMDYKFFDKYSL